MKDITRSHLGLLLNDNRTEIEEMFIDGANFILRLKAVINGEWLELSVRIPLSDTLQLQQATD